MADKEDWKRVISNKKLILDLIDMSEQDLESSNILYNKEKYPQAIFFLQQSIEKTTKAVGLLLNPIKGLQGINHKTILIYLNSSKEYVKDRLKKFDEVLERYPNLNETKLMKKINFKEYYQEQKISLEKLEDLVREKSILSDSEKEMMSILNEIKSFLKDFEESEEDIHQSLGSNLKNSALKEGMDLIKEFKDEVEKLGGIKNTDDLENIDYTELRKATEDYAQNFIKLDRIWMINFFLTLITYQHAVKCRYPEKKITPLEKYTKSYPLVKHYQEIYNLQKINIITSRKYLLEFFSKAERLPH